ncbi:Hypothetical predicted protein [Cloeon dipterum]|uniref:Uncharacterized protein n=1 Tax=Cloeon dipterum TaxID=197152 RepID=A0A8S1DSW3_9INSE|nr:Hypothetical predicted protein [Cloeon dipterum]
MKVTTKMLTKGGNKRELRLLEINGTGFVVIFNFMPMEFNAEKNYHYWMMDCMWPELESLVQRSSLNLAGQTPYNHKILLSLFKTEESTNLKVKISYVPDIGSLKDALDVDDDYNGSISEINIKAEVHFKGDRSKLKAALDTLQHFNEPENIRAAKVRLPKTPIKKKPFKQLQNYSGDQVDSDIECLSPKPEPPWKASTHKEEEKRKSTDDSQEEAKKIKISKESKAAVRQKKGRKSKVDKNQPTLKNFFSPSQNRGKSILSQEEDEKIERICSLDRKSDTTDSQEDIFADDCNVVAEHSPLKLTPKENYFTPNYDSVFDSPQPSTSKCNLSESQTARFVMLSQSPVKANTPMRKHSQDEDAIIKDNYPDPDDAEFRKCCKQFRKVLENGDTDVMDCAVIEKMFKAHTDYLWALHNGKVPSLLREEFLKTEDNGYAMHYEEGGLLFSFENLNMLTNMVAQTVHESKDEQNKNMNYTIKVLMPELIARIVMSVYKVSKQDALKKIRDISIYQSHKIFNF